MVYGTRARELTCGTGRSACGNCPAAWHCACWGGRRAVRRARHAAREARCDSVISCDEPAGPQRDTPRARTRTPGETAMTESDDRTTSPLVPVDGTATARTAAKPTRLDRRKARTRRALIDAAVRLIAEGRGDRASIQEITETADIGFGSFYNHFESKDQLFQTASHEVLDRWGTMIDQACTGIQDPAEVFAASLRISGRLSWTHPDFARF